jgi:hypothetical protein
MKWVMEKRKCFPHWFPFWKLYPITPGQLSGDKASLLVVKHDRYKDELVDEGLRKGS